MHPELFSIGSFVIGTYGVIVAAGVFISILVGRRLAAREGLDPESVTDVYVYAILAAFAGSKIALVIGDFRAFSEDPLDYLFQNLRSFGAFYGGFAAAFLVALFFVRRKKLPLRAVADVTSVVLPLGQALGRLGCFFAGCCYGSPTALPWGMVFPYVETCADGTRIHPWPLYESALDISIFLFLLRFFGRRSFKGQSFLLYAVLYAGGRFLLEFFRGDEMRGLYFGNTLSLSQVFALSVLAAAVPAYVVLKKKAGVNGR